MTHFDTELAALKARLVELAAIARDAVRASVDALLSPGTPADPRVADAEARLDRGEKEVDERAVELFTHAPLATQLRLLVVATKIAHDLERVGDEATTVARRARALAGTPPPAVAPALARMRDLALGMLDDAMDAFVSGDTAKARAVVPRDRDVDALHKEVSRDVAAAMHASPDAIGPGLHLLTASKALERIADHAKNIAEDTVYLHEAKDIRHEAPPAA